MMMMTTMMIKMQGRREEPVERSSTIENNLQKMRLTWEQAKAAALHRQEVRQTESRSNSLWNNLDTWVGRKLAT